jgi:MT-A70
MTTSAQSHIPFSTPCKYGVILADPPWSFLNWSAKGTGRNAISHYDCMDFSALASLPIANLAANDCSLFLWATDPLLPCAFELIQAWGFEYKTVGFYWVKLNTGSKHGASYFTGLGYWTRANPEQCLLATHGKPRRLLAMKVLEFRIRHVQIDGLLYWAQKYTQYQSFQNRLGSVLPILQFEDALLVGWHLSHDRLSRLGPPNVGVARFPLHTQSKHIAYLLEDPSRS